MKYKTIKLSVLLNSLVLMVNAANIAYIPKAAPGDTATAGAGKQWPTTRFVVSGDCVIDNLTGLMWAKNANLLARGTWGSSSTSGTVQYMVAQMNTNSSATGYHLCGYSDWRLPNQNELLSLFNYAAVGGGQSNWLNTQGFTDVQSSYWSSTQGGSGAWYVNMISLSMSISVSTTNSAWPVRGGQ
jgi:hypothetical protein